MSSGKHFFRPCKLSELPQIADNKRLRKKEIICCVQSVINQPHPTHQSAVIADRYRKMALYL